MTEQLTLPISSWEDVGSMAVAGGGRMKRDGSVKEAGSMLWGYQKDAIYLLIEAGEIKAVKRGRSRNAAWRVDLMSVWEYRQRVLKENQARLERV